MSTKATEVRALVAATLVSGIKKTPIFSLSAARNEEGVILYLGIHGTTIQLELDDKDAESMYLVLQEMVFARQ